MTQSPRSPLDRLALLLSAGCLLGAGAHPAFADSERPSGIVNELRLGVLAHDVPGLWSGFNREDGLDINAELLFRPLFEVFGGSVHPAAGISVNSAGDTSRLYLDLRWQIENSAGFFFATGLGLAVHDGNETLVDLDRKALGSQVLFHIPFEIGMRLDQANSVSVYFDHVSNADTADVNEGLDSLGIRYGYRF